MFALMLLLGLCCAEPNQTATKPAIAPADFRKWFDAASEGRLSIPAEVRRNASRYRYVFVDGLYIGLPQGCFVQNAKELRAKGVLRQAIHFINPSSHETVEGNADSVRSEILAIAARGPEKLVVIAHSRGACDALAFALENPDFVADHIRALFLIQGPFGGTGLADYVAGEGSAMDRRMPPVPRMAGQIMGRLQVSSLSQGKHGAIASLTRRASDNFWEEELEAHRDAIPVIAPLTFYVTSRTRASRHPLFQRVTARYLGTYYGPNDGLIALEDQAISGLGTVLAVLDAGHMDLTHRFPSARPKQRLRRALVDAIIMAVGRSAERGEDTRRPKATQGMN